MRQKLVLIDGHSILNRAFYGLPNLTNANGVHTNAVYGFLNILFKTIEEERPDYLTVAFDLKAPTFRHKMYSEYKGTRKPTPEELRTQVPLIKEVLQAMGVCIIQKEGYEADDLLGTLAKAGEKKDLDVTVLSGDRDLLQLASETIKIRIPKTKAGKTTIENYYIQDVIDRYQVTPIQIVDLKALMGDTADNIPGIPGVGEKTATKIIVEFGNIENAYAHVDELMPNKARESLRDNYDKAQISKELATICVSVPLDYNWDDALVRDFYTKEAYQYFQELGFKNLLSRFSITREEPQIEQAFKLVEQLQDVELIFTNISEDAIVGVQIIEEGDELIGISLATGSDVVVYMPIQGFLTPAYLSDKIASLIRSGSKVAVLNAKLLLKHVAIEECCNLYDVAVAAYLLNPLQSEYTYDAIARDWGELVTPAKAELLGKLSFTKADTKAALTYAGYMAYVPMKTLKPLLDKLDEKGMSKLYSDIEMPLLFSLHRMEQVGIKVAGDELKKYGEALAIRITELEDIIYQQAAEQFNINSPKQLGVILFEKLNLPGGKKTKTGYSTAADVLERLASEHEIVKSILEYRQLTKLKSTYADGLANYIAVDGRIHSNFNQTITATGRISSTEPNLQNIPVRMELGRLIRKVFVAKEGYVFVDADYSQIELRVLAHFSQDEKLIQAYREAKDIHQITASQVFHTPFDEVTSLQRRNAKAVNFGIVYGISSFGLSQDLSITRKEAKEYIEKYFETYPSIKGFLDKTVADAKQEGFVTTLFGRIRPIPELASSNFMQRSFGERIAMNSPIQGTAADIMKIAMIRVDNRLRNEKLRSQLVLQVHDELLVETHAEEVAQVQIILREEMQNAAQLSVPLEVDINVGANWYDAK
jgi:DNA polymerase I